MKKHRKHIRLFVGQQALLAVLFLLFSHGTRAQAVQAFASLDTNAIVIGDQIGMEIGIRIPNNFLVNWPMIGDTLNAHIEVLRQGSIDTLMSDNGLQLSQRLLITSFDSGYFEIHPMEFRFHSATDTSVFETNTGSLFLQVYTPEVDTTQAFKAIKGPISEPYTFMELLPWLLLGLAGLALLVLLFWYLRKRKKNQTVFVRKAKPMPPPHIIALEKFENLRLAKVWQQGKLKAYFTSLTDITREYLELRFHFDAPEMTTDEILQAIKEVGVNKEVSQKLKSVLELADLVKFAKENPTPLENDLCLSHCVDFVNETKQLAETLEVKNMSEQPIKKEA